MSTSKAFNLARNIWIPASAILLIRKEVSHTSGAGSVWEVIVHNSASFKLSNQTGTKSEKVIEELLEYFGIDSDQSDWSSSRYPSPTSN